MPSATFLRPRQRVLQALRMFRVFRVLRVFGVLGFWLSGGRWGRRATVSLHVLIGALVLTFAAAFVAVAIVAPVSRFHTLAVERARTEFSLVAERSADQLRTTLAGAVTAVNGHALLAPERVLAGGQLDEASLLPGLLATLRANERIYSVYYGLADGAFLQVIAVRGSAEVAAAVRAPADTWYAVRAIGPAVRGGGSTETWRYLGADEHEIDALAHASVYVPSERNWYLGAMASAGVEVTPTPYMFESLRDLGLTLSRALPGGGGVFGLDISLDGIDQQVTELLRHREGGILVTTSRGEVLAGHAAPRLNQAAPTPLQPIDAAASPLFAVAGSIADHDGGFVRDVNGESFVFFRRSVPMTAREALHVMSFAPARLYTGPIEAARDGIVLIAVVVLLIVLTLSTLIGRHVTRALRSATAAAERIRRLDFTGDAVPRSGVYEVDMLGAAQQTMQEAIRARTAALDTALARLEALVAGSTRLSACTERASMIAIALSCMRDLAAQAGAEDVARTAVQDGLPTATSTSTSTSTAAQRTTAQFWLAGRRDELKCLGALGPDLSAADVARACAAALAQDDTVRPRAPGHGDGVDGAVPVLAVPVRCRGKRPAGVLVLAGTPVHEDGVVRHIEVLATLAGTTLDHLALVDEQRALMESMVQLLAGAIDAKSAYTGAHCARVPELAGMLAEAACAVDTGPLAGFAFRSEAEWREFRIGAWLHDCGKITTPESVVDKATKLETIWNRIHEIRTRFEVLLRDAEIDRLRMLLAGGERARADAVFERRRATLTDDFAFVARCNVGGESMPAADAARIRAIGAQTWMRHFDDRLGLSHIEEARFAGRPAPDLPVAERLLADRPEHIVPRAADAGYDARHGFSMSTPEHLYHYGELHNLCVSRGTLTPEERYKINEHIIQTVVMLDQLPWPPDLRRVPEYASTHHETLTGTGYPRGLVARDLSVPSRIMAIADIFEALTAADRPYKRAKPLSEAVRLLAGFRARGHIDGDLFELFLTSGVYRRYAEMFLAREQIDEVDIAAYLH